MFGQKNTLRQAMAAVDAEIAATVTDTGHALEEFASDIPLKGLSAQTMHDIEKRGLELCKARYSDIMAEIQRLEQEARSMEAIIAAGTAKLSSLQSFLGPAQAAPKATVPPMKHTDIRADRAKAAPVVVDSLNPGPSPVIGEAQTLELDDAEQAAVDALR